MTENDRHEVDMIESPGTKRIKRVLFIQPPDPEGMIIVRDHMGKFGIMEKKTSVVREDVFPPLDLAYSAALLEKHGYEVAIIDSPTLGLNRSKVLRQTVAFGPDLIVVNTCGVAIGHDLDFAGWLKKTIEISVCAIAPTYIPPGIIEQKDIDVFIYGGEFEMTILELCHRWPMVEGVQGTFYREGKDSGFKRNPPRPFIKTLDELPFPAYHLLPMGKYSHDLFKGKRFSTVLFSRGCPFGCEYCLYPLGCGDKWRGREPESMVKELKLLRKKYRIQAILFRDQVFNFDKKRTKELCDLMVKERLNIEWRCEMRADLVDRELLEKMKAAGCVGIHMGIESGDIDILRSVAKGCINDDYIEKVKQVFKDARKIGIEALAFFMIGFPGETRESVSKTFELARELNAARAWFSPLVPYPGTPLYEKAKKNGWILTEDLKEYTGRKVVMVNGHLTAEEIQIAIDSANAMFSKDKKNLLRTIFSQQGVKSMLMDPRKAARFTIGRFANRGRFMYDKRRSREAVNR